MLESFIYLLVAVVTVGIPLVYIHRERRKSARAAQVLQKSIERGHDPISLHPVINPNICIGSGACVKACPETDVLGLVDGRGALINPSHCIGHGMCAAACPVEAITLVFGTARRGVDIPHVSGKFESNVPGIYIAGELGGMGLIRNATVQGQQAVQNIAADLGRSSGDDLLDLVIVGAGPAGIAASLQAKKESLKFVILDQQDLGGTVLTYPRRKLVMTRPLDLPLYGTVRAREIAKETLMEIFEDVFEKTGVQVRAGERVENIRRDGEPFVVQTIRGEYRCKRVLLAIGRRGTPRKLDVPGETSAKVSYRLLEPEAFHHLRILVVGGGDSAVETALALADQPGNTVHVSYRKESFFRLKEGNQIRVDAAIHEGRIVPLFGSSVLRIDPETVQLQQGDREFDLPNDHVFVMAGGELPTTFLQKIGVEVTRKFGQR